MGISPNALPWIPGTTREEKAKNLLAILRRHNGCFNQVSKELNVFRASVRAATKSLLGVEGNGRPRSKIPRESVSDLRGKRYEYLTILKPVDRAGRAPRGPWALCRCVCGNTVERALSHIRYGGASCGCKCTNDTFGRRGTHNNRTEGYLTMEPPIRTLPYWLPGESLKEKTEALRALMFKHEGHFQSIANEVSKGRTKGIKRGTVKYYAERWLNYFSGDLTYAKPPRDQSGEKFGVLTITKKVARGNRMPLGQWYECKCDCGQSVELAIGTIIGKRKGCSMTCQLLSDETRRQLQKAHETYHRNKSTKQRELIAAALRE